MPYDVHVEQAGPRVLAAVRAVTTPTRLSTDIIRVLDQVWPLLREQGARTGHNVVIYYPGEGGEFPIEAGVEVFSAFEERGAVRRVTTPAGEAAVVAHYGEYSAMGDAYAALDQWCAANGRHLAGVNWEVYGDWDDDRPNGRPPSTSCSPPARVPVIRQSTAPFHGCGELCHYF